MKRRRSADADHVRRRNEGLRKAGRASAERRRCDWTADPARGGEVSCQPADWRALALAAERAALAAMRAGDRLTFGDGALIRIDQITDGRVYFVRWSPGSEVGAPTQMDAATVSYEIIERGPVTWRRCDDTDTDGGTAP